MWRRTPSTPSATRGGAASSSAAALSTTLQHAPARPQHEAALRACPAPATAAAWPDSAIDAPVDPASAAELAERVASNSTASTASAPAPSPARRSRTWVVAGKKGRSSAPAQACSPVVLLSCTPGKARRTALLVTALAQASEAAAACYALGAARKVSVVLLAPTTELAAVLHREAKQLAGSCGGLTTQVQLVHGGGSMPSSLSALRTCPDILIATPGRLLQLLLQHGPQLQHLFSARAPGLAAAAPHQTGASRGRGGSLALSRGTVGSVGSVGEAGAQLLLVDEAEHVMGLPLMRTTLSSIRRLLQPRQLLLACHAMPRGLQMEAEALGMTMLQEQGKMQGQGQGQGQGQEQLGRRQRAGATAAAPLVTVVQRPLQLLQVLQLAPLPSDPAMQAALAMISKLPAATAGGVAATAQQGLLQLNSSSSSGSGSAMAAAPTVEQVESSAVTLSAPTLRCLPVPADQVSCQLYGLLRHYAQHHAAQQQPFRAIVMCPTAAITMLYARLYRGMGLRTLELHSRMPRSKAQNRHKVLERFRTMSAQIAQPDGQSGTQFPVPGLQHQQQAAATAAGVAVTGAAVAATAPGGVVLFATEALLFGTEVAARVDLLVQVGAARDHLHLQKQLGVAAALHQSVAGKRRKQQGLQQQGSMQGPQQGMPQQGPQQQGNMQASQQGQPQGQQQQGQQQGGQQQQGQQQPLSQSLVHVMLVTTQEQAHLQALWRTCGHPSPILSLSPAPAPLTERLSVAVRQAVQARLSGAAGRRTITHAYVSLLSHHLRSNRGQTHTPASAAAALPASSAPPLSRERQAIQAANQWVAGLIRPSNPPPLSRALVARMGLANTPGIAVASRHVLAASHLGSHMRPHLRPQLESRSLVGRRAGAGLDSPRGSQGSPQALRGAAAAAGV